MPAEPAGRTGGPRILVLADAPGWRADSGYHQRARAVLSGLAAAGEVHWVTVSPADAPPDDAPAGVPARTSAVRAGRPPRWVVLARSARRGQPRQVGDLDWAGAAAALPGVLRGPYDLVWFEHPEVWRGLRDAVDAPATVVDLDNLMSEVVTRSARHEPSRARRVLARRDARLWRALERDVQRRARAVVVCSELDRRKSGGTARVVPNGASALPTGPRPAGGPSPVLVFVAAFYYPPNLDAARWLVREVWPLVRRAAPGARLRLVGQQGGDGGRGLEAPGVEVAGFVDDVVAEVDAASVCLAPLRSGGGTRIKVLEAFGAGRPVVATSVGAEGIDARDGEHLLVRDDAAGFADACVQLLRDDALADRLAAAARALHAERYRWSVTEDLVTRLARSLLPAG